MECLYYIVATCHIVLIFFTLFGWLSNNRKVLVLLVCLQIITIFLFVYFNGCIITKLERKICNSKKRPTTIDPVLKFMGFKVNGKNRRIMTMSLFLLAFIATLNKLDEVYHKRY